MDSLDYLLSGVMNGNAGGMPLPENIESDMVIGMLDTCDDIIDSYRRSDHAFDVGCDERYVIWERVPFAFADLKEGMSIHLNKVGDNTNPNGIWASKSMQVQGVIESIVTKEVNFGGFNEPERLGMVTIVTLEKEVVTDRFGYIKNTETDRFTDLDWNNGRGEVVVPIPLDASGFGKYPHTPGVEKSTAVTPKRRTRKKS